jgi:hypothetical protein
MNEASSKYVDQIATERLLREKLERVHHSPRPRGRFVEVGWDLNAVPRQPGQVRVARRGQEIEVSFASAVRTLSQENNQVRCLWFPTDGSSGDVVFVHGLYEDNLEIYGYLVSMLNKLGLNVYLLVLPYHYDRKPPESLFSGEMFLSADIDQSVLAYKQAVYDLYQLIGYVRSKAGRPVWVAGFSMGGGVVLSLAAMTALDGAFVINPVCNLSKLIWESTLFSTIRSDLEASGITFEELKVRYCFQEPLEVSSIRTDVNKIAVARGLYDQINDPSNYELLAARWEFKVLTYKAGHLNILRVPRLAADAHRFLEGVYQ